MAQDPIDFFYSDGTITLTNGSDIAQGAFTAWDPAVLPYDLLFANDGQGGASAVKEVLAVNQLRLAKAWTGPTLTNVPYFILRWIKHTDPRIYGVRVSDYLTRLKAIPDNIEQVAGEINADRQAVEAALTILAAIETAVDADRQAVEAANEAAYAAYQGAVASADEAEAWAQAASTTVLPNDSVTNAKLADMATGTIKGRVALGTGDPEDLTPAQGRTVLGVPALTSNLSDLPDKVAARASLGVGAQGNAFHAFGGDESNGLDVVLVERFGINFVAVGPRAMATAHYASKSEAGLHHCFGKIQIKDTTNNAVIADTTEGVHTSTWQVTTLQAPGQLQPRTLSSDELIAWRSCCVSTR
jgi:hypothetical protein